LHDVFISYSSINRTTADTICHHLEANGIRCWYAPRDIRASDTWASAIMDAIRGAKVFLLIYSKESNASGQVLNEVTNAFQQQCVIIPFRLDQTEMCDDLAYYLNAVHWLDASAPPMEARIRELCSVVQGVLSGTKHVKPKAEKKRTRPTAALFAAAVAVVAALAVMLGGLFGAASMPQDMRHFCISHIGNRSYFFTGSGMLSSDHERIFLTDRQTGELTFADIADPYALCPVLDYTPSDPAQVFTAVQDGNDTIYFVEGDTNLVYIYSKQTGAPLLPQGLPLPLEDREYVENYVFRSANLLSENTATENITLLIYREEETYALLSKLITLTPEGAQTVIDVSSLQLRWLLCTFRIPDQELLLMMDMNSHLHLLDLKTGTLLDVDHTTLYTQYMPQAVAEEDLLSSDKRYICQRQLTDSGLRCRVWDLQTGDPAFDKVFPYGCDAFFGKDGTLIYLDFSTGTLTSCDLASGHSRQLLSADFFDGNAFLDNVFHVRYLQEFDACLAVSGEDRNGGVDVMLTLVSTEGKILAKSPTIHLDHGNFFATLAPEEEYILLILVSDDPDAPLQGDEHTVIYRTLYSVDPEGNILFPSDP